MTKPGGGPVFAGDRLDVATANVGDLSVSGLLGAGTGFTVNSDLVLSLAISQIVPGVTSLSFRNNANNADNLILTDAGAATLRAGLLVNSGGLNVTGGLLLDSALGGLATGVVNVPPTGGLAVGGVKTLALRSASGSAAQINVAPQALGTITAETPSFNVGANTLTITGGFASQRFNYFRQPTVSAATSLAVTDAATMAIEGAPLAAGAGPAVLTRKYQLWLQGTDKMRFDTTTQATIGANGAASAPTANPVGYLPIYIGTAIQIIPYYNP